MLGGGIGADRISDPVLDSMTVAGGQSRGRLVPV